MINYKSIKKVWVEIRIVGTLIRLKCFWKIYKKYNLIRRFHKWKTLNLKIIIILDRDMGVVIWVSEGN